MVYDLAIPFRCSGRYACVGLFFALHSAVGLLFPIGIFPFVMMAGAIPFVRLPGQAFLEDTMGASLSPVSSALLSSLGGVAWVVCLDVGLALAFVVLLGNVD